MQLRCFFNMTTQRNDDTTIFALRAQWIRRFASLRRQPFRRVVVPLCRRVKMIWRSRIYSILCGYAATKFFDVK